jgi:hypothetical protein
MLEFGPRYEITKPVTGGKLNALRMGLSDQTDLPQIPVQTSIVILSLNEWALFSEPLNTAGLSGVFHDIEVLGIRPSGIERNYVVQADHLDVSSK